MIIAIIPITDIFLYNYRTKCFPEESKYFLIIFDDVSLKNP